MPHPLLVVATFGPACASPGGVAALRAAGADVLRLNGSHLDPEGLAAAVATAAAGGFPVRALLLDLQGGKTRTGTMPVPLSVAAGGSVRLAPEEARIPGAVPVDRAAFLAALRPGDRLALDDGRLHLRVLGPAPGGVAAVAENTGAIRGRRGLVFAGPAPAPSAAPDLPARDRALLGCALDLGIRTFALSCASDPRQVVALRAAAGVPISVAAKVEQRVAFDRLAALAGESEALWLCRGDLGAEVGPGGLGPWQARFLAEAPPPRLLAGRVLSGFLGGVRPGRAGMAELARLAPRVDGVVLSDVTAEGTHGPAAVAWLGRLARR